MFNTLAGDIPEPGDQVAATGVNLSGILGEVRKYMWERAVGDFF